MSTLKVDAIVDKDSGNTATINGQTISASNTQGKNLVFNGEMQIHQRGGTITLGTGLTYTLDRMSFYKDHAGTNTVEQSTDAPVGFSNSLKATTTVADASVAATDRVAMIYRMEGLDAAKLEFGTANAKTITISFYVRSSITGTHGGAVGNGSDNRAYPFTYTISDADTWERKSITVAGDTTGTWATTNARSLQVCWGLGVGSTYSGTADAWEAADRNSATGATTGVLTTANATWYITGIQIEVGASATNFEHRSYGDQLRYCQRYYARAGGTNYAQVFGAGGIANTTGSWFGFGTLPTPMRAGFSLTLSGGTPRIQNGQAGFNASSVSASMSNVNHANFSMGCNASGLTLYRWHNMDTGASAALFEFDAELQGIIMIITKAKYRNTSFGADIINTDIVATIDGQEIFVPVDEKNRHYIEIQKWVDEGNKIEDAD